MRFLKLFEKPGFVALKVKVKINLANGEQFESARLEKVLIVNGEALKEVAERLIEKMKINGKRLIRLNDNDGEAAFGSSLGEITVKVGHANGKPLDQKEQKEFAGLIQRLF